MEKLPTEIITHILGFLKLSNQLQLAQVSRQWRAAAEGCLRGRQRLTTSDLRPRRCTNETLRTALPRLPGLRTLHINHQHPDIDGALDVDIVSEHCRQLEDVDLSPFRLDASSVERLCERCPRLSVLRLPVRCDSDLLEPLLRRLSGLRVLALRDTPLSARCMALLPDTLERLTLTSCGLPSDLQRQPPTRWPALRDLVLTLTRVDTDSGSAWAHLVAGCPALERLEADCSRVTDHLLRELPSLRQLKHLNLSGCEELTEPGLTSCLGQLKRLETLDLNMVPSVTDGVLSQLTGAEQLSKITLGVEVYYQPIEFTMDALLRLVVSCPSLTSLRLALWEEDSLEKLIKSLVRQLSPDRHVTLTICETMLEELESSVPSTSRPLRIATFQDESREESQWVP